MKSSDFPTDHDLEILASGGPMPFNSRATSEGVLQ